MTTDGAPGGDAVIETAALVKDYGKVRALHGVDLHVKRGEVFGFIGPNGAGKSTLIRCLLDLLRPTSGTATVLDVSDLQRHPELRARVGYLPGELAMNKKLTAREHLAYLSSLRGGDGAERIEPLAKRFQLDLDRPFRGLSKGNKQKVGVVQAFMHAPELLILDEPTSGLDPLLQKEFLALVAEAHADGATVFISSHILSEVEAVAERVGIIRAGRLVATELVTELRARAGQHVELAFDDAPPEDALRDVDGLTEVTITEHVVRGVLRGSPDALLKLAAQHTVTHWHAQDRNLEELFMEHYRPGSDEADA